MRELNSINEVEIIEAGPCDKDINMCRYCFVQFYRSIWYILKTAAGFSKTSGY